MSPVIPALSVSQETPPASFDWLFSQLSVMADLSSLPELPLNINDDVLELNKDLERIIEDVENISVQLTWMAYDLVALRTSPELGAAMEKLEEAYPRCFAVVCGDQKQQPEMDMCPDSTATTPTQM
ncbi:hypothetical protein PFLUV_G00116340 [Perca fluviatilis]|uniref:Uncharacterized protein n=2 Tax=Perca fluviatilis TaxID=8168 RepID=A0A6A5F1X9_PERFL|nr:hypothetical protein PFLUV_G00116340 [Perca fluviatilis]